MALPEVPLQEVVRPCLLAPGLSAHTVGHSFCSRLLQVHGWVEAEGLGGCPSTLSWGASACWKLMGGRAGEFREGPPISLRHPG